MDVMGSVFNARGAGFLLRMMRTMLDLLCT